MYFPPELGTSFWADLAELTLRGKDDHLSEEPRAIVYREGPGDPSKFSQSALLVASNGVMQCGFSEVIIVQALVMGVLCFGVCADPLE